MESRTFLVYLSDSLIRYLGKSLPNKASRYEAFQYIIGKQKEKIDLDRDGGANVPFLAKVSEQKHCLFVPQNAPRRRAD